MHLIIEGVVRYSNRNKKKKNKNIDECKKLGIKIYWTSLILKALIHNSNKNTIF